MLPESANGAGGSLVAHDVSVRFGGVQALSDVSVDVPAGSLTGLIGPNGAGKTTLFNVMTGLQRPDAGHVALGGRDISRWGPHRRARHGMARTFQRLELFWSLTVAENVLVGAESELQWWGWPHVRRTVQGRLAPSSAAGSSPRDAVPALLERVGLAGLADEHVDGLPTGQARLVELARALAIGPDALLLDEPGSGLDDSESKALGDLLVELARSGMAVLLVEHDMDLVMRICDTVIVLDSGAVIARGSPDVVQRDPSRAGGVPRRQRMRASA